MTARNGPRGMDRRRARLRDEIVGIDPRVRDRPRTMGMCCRYLGTRVLRNGREVVSTSTRPAAGGGHSGRVCSVNLHSGGMLYDGTMMLRPDVPNRGIAWPCDVEARSRAGPWHPASWYVANIHPHRAECHLHDCVVYMNIPRPFPSRISMHPAKPHGTWLRGMSGAMMIDCHVLITIV